MMGWKRIAIVGLALVALVASALLPAAAEELRTLAAALVGWALPSPGGRRA